MARKALGRDVFGGRGIDAVFGSIDEDKKSEEKDFQLMLDPRELKANPYQPRRHFDEASLEELSNSIKVHGLIQPVVVQKDSDGSYFIIAGERRTRASIMAGLEKIPVVVSDVKDENKLEVALIENIQREDLNPIEEAQAYQAIIEMGNLTQEELSFRVGKRRSTITNTIRLLQLSPEMQSALKDGRMSAGHAKALLSIEDLSRRVELFREIIEKHLSVRQAENKASSIVKGKRVPNASAKEKLKDNDIKNIEQQFIERLGTKVAIKGGLEAGVIEISYFTKENLDHLYEMIIKDK
ncbi:MAG: ParB/RepB/Spo0J family partition protein [Treponema sp.]